MTFTTSQSYIEVPGWRKGDLAFSFRTTGEKAILLYQPPIRPNYPSFMVALTDGKCHIYLCTITSPLFNFWWNVTLYHSLHLLFSLDRFQYLKFYVRNIVAVKHKVLPRKIPDTRILVLFENLYCIALKNLQNNRNSPDVKITKYNENYNWWRDKHGLVSIFLFLHYRVYLRANELNVKSPNARLRRLTTSKFRKKYWMSKSIWIKSWKRTAKLKKTVQVLLAN